MASTDEVTITIDHPELTCTQTRGIFLEIQGDRSKEGKTQTPFHMDFVKKLLVLREMETSLEVMKNLTNYR